MNINSAALLFAILLFSILPIDGQTNDVTLARARSAIEKNEFATAKRDIETVLAKSPTSDAALALRALCKFREYLSGVNGPEKTAKQDAENALKINPNNTLALAVRGLFRSIEKDSKGALADAERALQLDPRVAFAYMIRAYEKGSTRRADLTFDHVGALDEVEKAYKLAPNDVWIKDTRYRFAKGLSTPLAKQIVEETLRDKNSKASIALEKAKQKVTANLWDFKSYDELTDAFRAAGTDWQEVKAFWDGLISKNSNNICAIRFRGEYEAKDWRSMLSYLESGLNRFDGKNGATCAAQIAFRIGRELNDRKNYADADKYFKRALAIEPDLQYLKGNADANLDDKAAADKFEADLKRSQQELAASGTKLGGASKNKLDLSPIERRKMSDTIAEYDRMHSALERDMSELRAAYNKFAGAGAYRIYYKGTYQRIGATLGRMNSRVNDFLKKHGDFLPQQLKDHLQEDLAEIAGVQVPPLY